MRKGTAGTNSTKCEQTGRVMRVGRDSVLCVRESDVVRKGTGGVTQTRVARCMRRIRHRAQHEPACRVGSHEPKKGATEPEVVREEAT